MPPSISSEALSVRLLDIHSASSGIDGGTGCNFIFFSHSHCSSDRVMSKNSSTNSRKYEVNISLEETEALFLIVLDIWNSETLCEPILGV